MSRLSVGSLIAVVLYAASSTAAAGQTQPGSTGSSRYDSKAPTILFMCPHGAAKSVLASAYFQRLAKERGQNVRVESGGTEPDATVSPAVAAHLSRSGHALPVSTPRKVTPEEFAAADIVISIGCDLSQLPQPAGRLVRWDEVPPLSEDFARADDAIRKRVTALVEELLREASKKK